MTQTDLPRRSGPPRRAAVTVMVVVVVGAATVVLWSATTHRPAPGDTSPQVRTATATVTRGTVTERTQIGGTLTFDGSYTVVHQGAPGVLTTLPAPGDVVARGERLYSVDARPVRLLYGTTPAYRDLGPATTDGADVRQLERNLVALGMDPGRDIVVDAHFTWATSAAVRRWEASWGLPSWRRDGRLAMGEVVFLPGRLRVRQVRAALASTVRPDTPVLGATSTRQVITARIGADRRRLVRARDRVRISMTGAEPLRGTVLRIGRVATAPPQNDSTQGGEAPATVTVVIGVRPPRGGPALDQAPVRLSITTATRKDVLMVPVTALLARPGGGYQVRLADGRLAGVEPGLFDDSAGTVEVTGALRPGDRVEVPSP
ncbi:hypothetical protein [Streptosporangium sp. LJ11]|uniref:hypothetical protein n=1 Tax=Streptosporangium sp. LJ11 TaxID=3436927 RepID=UPI003F7ADCF9